MELKERVKQHFDVVSPYYHKLWGMHIHHGFWIKGDESKEKAQEQLIDELIRRGGVKPNSKILDVGCGIGGTAIYLSKKLNANVTGITISPTQVEIANDLTKEHKANISIILMDGENVTIDDKFDVIWTVEAIPHYYNKENFFSSASKLLNTGGKVIIGDWFKSEHLTHDQEKKYIKPIEKGMLLPGLCTLNEYINYLYKYGFRLISAEDVVPHVAKTWDLTLDIIRRPSIWRLATKNGKDFVAFLRSFRAMKKACSTRTFVYGMIVAEKVS